MKIALISIVFALVIVLLLMRPKDADFSYAEQIDSELSLGMTIHELSDLHAKYNNELEIWNLCVEEHQEIVTECEKGFSAITPFLLPTTTIIYSEGTAQFYFQFSRDGKLESWFYEIYYPENH